MDMKKLMSIPICILLVSLVFLSGCTEESDEDNISEDINRHLDLTDSDQDGRIDSQDDFPFDPVYTILDVVWGPVTLILDEGDFVTKDYDLQQPWGTIYIDWRSVNSSSLSESDLHNITFDITKPSATPYTNRFYQDNMTARALYYHLDYPDMGAWNFLFTNHGEQPVALYIWIYWAH